MNTPVLPMVLRKVAEQHSEAIALKHGERQITYGELQKQIDRMTHCLSNHISNGDKVALLLDNSIPYVVACYAIWQAGGVVVALNTALQADEQMLLLQHCEARILIIGKAHGLLKKLENSPAAPLVITLFASPRLPIPVISWQSAMEESTAPGFSGVLDNTAVAMIIYTSGTTGKPKGVMLSHANLAENVRAICCYLDLRMSDVVMCVLPFFYSYGNSILHTHLISASTLVLENSFMYPQKVLESMVREKVRVFYGVPSTYYLLLARTELTNFDLSSLRLCAQAGGHMDPQRIALVQEKIPQARFVVMYGQTEASARISYLPAELRARKSGSVGLAIPGVDIVVKREDGSKCQPGEQGEVCVSGPNVMRGYLKDNEQTARVLRAGCLHTGDLGYKDEEGFLYLLGRNSEMIKTGAHRVSPLEIEELVASVDGVVEAAAVAQADEVLGSVIACWIVRAETSDEQNLRRLILRCCKEKLPAYKVPKALYFLEVLPKTASGKIKKHELIDRNSLGRV